MRTLATSRCRSRCRRTRLARASLTLVVSLAFGVGCGARTGFLVDDSADTPTDAGLDASIDASFDASPDRVTPPDADAAPDVVPDAAPDVQPGCAEGTERACGSSVGACKPGLELCRDGVFGACQGAVGPKPEACNGIDENCNGTVNDCEPGSGTCTPSLTVTGSTPSSPGCIDFPVSKGATGSLTYTCPGTGGSVSAVLGGVTFSGTVTNNVVSLDAYTTTAPPVTPDGCTWQEHHHIEGNIPSGQVQYSYSERVLVNPPGVTCWQPCTEVGTVAIAFPGGH